MAPYPKLLWCQCQAIAPSSWTSWLYPRQYAMIHIQTKVPVYTHWSVAHYHSASHSPSAQRHAPSSEFHPSPLSCSHAAIATPHPMSISATLSVPNQVDQPST